MGYVVDKEVLETDPHFEYGCSFCHEGDGNASAQADAHKGLVKRPSDNLDTCGTCHSDIAATYKLSLHYTNAGMKNGVSPRFSSSEKAMYDEKVFEQSCRSCHASCGDCHVQSPIVSGVNTGFIKGHDFVRKDESKTCALCHGGRVYPEFTGDYGGRPDVHYRNGMTCLDCHSATQMHGDGVEYAGRRDVAIKPSCMECHKDDMEATELAKDAHGSHGDAVSCSACHTATGYRQCSSCHLGEGATSSPAIVLGDNPRKPGQLTTLRLIPTVRDTFKKAGIAQENFDALPNLWDSVPHNIQKRTDRTRDCGTCHSERLYFLDEAGLPKGGSAKNLELVR
ncbi:MAG TPA: cytochrome c3 family protein [Rectinemataceae bacterium]